MLHHHEWIRNGKVGGDNCDDDNGDDDDNDDDVDDNGDGKVM